MIDVFGTKRINKLESEVREAYAQDDDIAVLVSDIKKQVELAYGLLWIVGCDRSTINGNALSLARKALYAQLDKAGQARGIDAARKHLDENPYIPMCPHGNIACTSPKSCKHGDDNFQCLGGDYDAIAKGDISN